MARIIVDSNCDLPETLIRKYAITILPMLMSIDGVEYRDKYDIQPAAVYAAMRAGIVPKTSQVDYDRLHSVFTDFCERGESFIYIAFSSAMSGTYATARMILGDYRERYPGLDMEIVDSRGGCVTTGLIAMQAADMLTRDVPFRTVVENILEMTRHGEHVFTLPDLKWLIKGGRIDPFKGMIGTLLNVKPIIDVQNGAMQIAKKARGAAAAFDLVVELVRERAKNFPEQLIGIAHTDNPGGAEELKNAIGKALADAPRFMVCEIGSVLSAHVGIGGLGAFFFNERFPFYRQLELGG